MAGIGPTLIYPVGGEQIDSSFVNIRWDESDSAISQVSYVEIRAAQGEDIFTEERSYVIGRTIPGVKNFTWYFNSSLSGLGLRISVRFVFSNGARSVSSVSYSNFNIIKRIIPSPVLIEPKSNTSIIKNTLIVFDNTSYDNIGASKMQYFLYASSESAEAFYLKIAENVPVGTGSLSWNVEGLRNASDWYIHVYAADDFGRRSATVNIGPFSIGDPGFVIFDTEPPEVIVKINRDNYFTRNREINIKVYAEDEGTEVHSMVFIELERIQTTEGILYYDFGFDGSNTNRFPRPYTIDNVFQLYDKDGRHYLNVFAQDYGGNRNDSSSSKDVFPTKKPNLFREFITLKQNQFFRTVKFFPKNVPPLIREPGSVQIYDGNEFMASVASEESAFDILVSMNRHSGITTLAQVEAPIIEIGKLLSNIYVSVGNLTRTMDVRQLVSNKIEPRFSRPNDFGTEVTAIGADGFGNLFLGCLNGDLWVVTGGGVNKIGTLAGTVTSIVAGNNGAAFICAGNSGNIYTASPTSVTSLEVTL
jgi:hypothetical protein